MKPLVKKEAFLAGRDLAIAMLRKVQAEDINQCALSGQFRVGRPQRQPLAAAFAELRTSPELEDGFLAMLTDFLAHTAQSVRLASFAGLTYEQMRGDYAWPAEEDEEEPAVLAMLEADDPDALETPNRCTTPQLIARINTLNADIGDRCSYVQHLCDVALQDCSYAERVEAMLHAIKDADHKIGHLEYELRGSYEVLVQRLHGGAA